VELLEAMLITTPAQPIPFSMSGLLAYLVSEGLKDLKPRLKLILRSFKYEHLKDAVVCTIYLRAATLLGMEEEAIKLIEKHPDLINNVHEDILKIYPHLTAVHLEENNHVAAYSWIDKAKNLASQENTL